MKERNMRMRKRREPFKYELYELIDSDNNLDDMAKRNCLTKSTLLMANKKNKPAYGKYRVIQIPNDGRVLYDSVYSVNLLDN